MFNTIGSFSAVYFTLAAILFILVLFEKHFIHLEDKIRADRAKSKKSVKRNKSSKPVNKAAHTSAASRKNCVRNSGTIRKIPNNAA